MLAKFQELKLYHDLANISEASWFFYQKSLVNLIQQCPKNIYRLCEVVLRQCRGCNQLFKDKNFTADFTHFKNRMAISFCCQENILPFWQENFHPQVLILFFFFSRDIQEVFLKKSKCHRYKVGNFSSIVVFEFSRHDQVFICKELIVASKLA